MAECESGSEGVILRLEGEEVKLLQFMGRELRRLLENGDADHPVLKPFFPRQQRQQDEEAVAAGLEDEMDLELQQLRLTRIEGVQAELLKDCSVENGGEIILTSARSDTWLAYLADLRLLLAAVIGITPSAPDPFMASPSEDWTMEMRMYEFLSVLQEWILSSLMGEE